MDYAGIGKYPNFTTIEAETQWLAKVAGGWGYDFYFYLTVHRMILGGFFLPGPLDP